MKNSIKRWVGRVPDVSAVMARFPVPTALMAVFTIGLIFGDQLRGYERFFYVLTGLVIAGYLCVSFIISRESRKLSPAVFMQAGIVLLILACAWIAKPARLEPAMAVGVSVLILGNAVLYRQARNDLKVWDFTHMIWTGAAFATLGSIIFTLGILAIDAALSSLFGLNLSNFTEDLILPIGLGFLAPLYWLSTIPAVDEPISDLTDNPGFVSKAVAFMGTWLLSPLTLTYALILVAYGVKIILAGSLPKGEMAALTTPFLLIGTLTWLLLDPPFIREKTLATLFRKNWFFLSIPAALLLSISVGVRVAEYGLTDERVALILCCVWALVVGLWFCFAPKAKRDIRIIPGFAAILLTLGAFGSLGLSHMNQMSRIESGLKQAGVMTEAGLIRPLEDIKVEDKAAAEKAYGALQYLERNDEHKAILKLFKGADDVPSLVDDRFQNLYKRLGIEDYRPKGRYEAHESYTYRNSNSLIEMQAAGWITDTLQVNWNQTSDYEKIHLASEPRISTRSGVISVLWPDKGIDTQFDINDWQANLPRNGNSYELNDPKIKLQDTPFYRVDMLIKSLNYNDYSDEKNYNLSLRFKILVTENSATPNP
ncbi:MAG: DUF4153 domain-containing protein [Alphaproteobacteria bacterium]